jgi:hypothetical protein
MPKRLERTRRERASVESCVGEPLKRNVRCLSPVQQSEMMSRVETQDPKGAGVLIGAARLVTWAVPMVLWIIHVFVIVPALNSKSGDDQFLTAMQFFMVSALLMIGCFVLSLVVYFKHQSRVDLVPVLLNLSWLYYVKVLFTGPTIGNL